MRLIGLAFRSKTEIDLKLKGHLRALLRQSIQTVCSQNTTRRLLHEGNQRSMDHSKSLAKKKTPAALEMFHNRGELTLGGINPRVWSDGNERVPCSNDTEQESALYILFSHSQRCCIYESVDA